MVVSRSKCQSLEKREQWVLQVSGIRSPNSQQHLGVFFYYRLCLNMSIFVRGEQSSSPTSQHRLCCLLTMMLYHCS